MHAVHTPAVLLGTYQVQGWLWGVLLRLPLPPAE